MVGLMNTTNLLVRFSEVRVLNNQRKTGMRERMGVPEPLRVLRTSSSPPSTIISSFFTRTSEKRTNLGFVERSLQQHAQRRRVRQYLGRRQRFLPYHYYLSRWLNGTCCTH